MLQRPDTAVLAKGSPPRRQACLPRADRRVPTRPVAGPGGNSRRKSKGSRSPKVQKGGKPGPTARPLHRWALGSAGFLAFSTPAGVRVAALVTAQSGGHAVRGRTGALRTAQTPLWRRPAPAQIPCTAMRQRAARPCPRTRERVQSAGGRFCTFGLVRQTRKAGTAQHARAHAREPRHASGHAVPARAHTHQPNAIARAMCVVLRLHK